MTRPPASMLVLIAVVGLTARADESDFFEAKIRPILVERCQKCHGDAAAKGGLKLTSRADLLAGGDEGPAAVAGKPDESAFIRAIRYHDDLKMPPKGKLAEAEIATLTRWVELGMPWPDAGKSLKTTPARPEAARFWSFQPIRDPATPTSNHIATAASEIDRFLGAAMQERGMRPAPAADKRTLIRRATFDLTGLPPTPEEIGSFLSDDTPDAFARVVDRLLASPAYGERWGRHWLDLVRYADARDARGIGGEDDVREAWRYRDWVVDAFNRDLPYDQFVRDQIAGDVGPEATPASIVATGMLAIGEWGVGDADKEKMLSDVVDDQIDVVGRTFMGLTIACARCHDHKFDPIPTADYYGLAGIFFSTRILPGPGPKTGGSPLLRTSIATREQVGFRNRLQQDRAEAEARYQAEARAASQTLARSLLPETGRYLSATRDLVRRVPGEPRQTLAAMAAARDLRPEVLGNWVNHLGLGGDGPSLSRVVENLRGVPGITSWSRPGSEASATINATAEEVAMVTFRLPARSVSVHPSPTSGVGVTWTSPIEGDVAITGRIGDGDSACGDGVAWELTHQRDEGANTLAAGAIDNGGTGPIGTATPGTVRVREGDRLRLVVRPRGSHACDTTSVTLQIRSTRDGATWDLASDAVAAPTANPIADRMGHPAIWLFAEENAARTTAPLAEPLARWRSMALSGSRGAADEWAKQLQQSLDHDPDLQPLRDTLTAESAPGYIEPKADLLHLFPAEIRTAITARRAERDRLLALPTPDLPLALAAQEGGVKDTSHEGFHDARIHIRGAYSRLGATVPRHVPSIVAGPAPPTITLGSGRKELAEWITRPDHPLTARVMVNRIWQYHFGEGIVRTPGNFGKLGEPPSNPDLLDWLARRFIESRWSIKTMHRLMMRTAAYQQSAATAPEFVRIDPEDRLFGRMNRRRLESEAVRDTLLAVAGSLDPTAGGPSYRDFATPRRTLYFMTVRSDRSAFGPLFDAADATAIVDRRTISTVAPQALFLLNNAFVVEQARRLAAMLLRDEAIDDRQRIARLYERAYGRVPRPEEVRIGLLATSGAGRLEDWSLYCQAVLCGNEFVYVD